MMLGRGGASQKKKKKRGDVRERARGVKLVGKRTVNEGARKRESEREWR
jgi:hypothetical protein